MKFIGADIVKKNLGYFGVRKCESCEAIKNVDLIELKGVFRICFIPVKTYIGKKFLMCQDCTACFEVSDEQWKYYSAYLNDRLDAKTTSEVVSKLEEIDQVFVNKGTKIDIQDEIYHPTLDEILSSLIKKYGHEESLQEIMSVYFSRNLNKKTD